MNDSGRSGKAPRRVEIVHEADLFVRGEFRLREARFRHERFDGNMSEELVRLSFERGDSVAALVHDVETDRLVLAEQFRYPSHPSGHGWMLELPAGMVPRSEAGNPDLTVRRELLEEVGVRPREIHRIMSFFASVGGSSERVFLYYVPITADDRDGVGGGVDGEDIRLLEPTVDDVGRALDAGEIHDAKTLIGLLWLRAHRAELPPAATR